MGFTAGLYTYPKYKDTTYQDLLTIENLLEYETNEWGQKHYSSAEEYAKSYREERYIPQPKDRVDFYREHMIPDEFGTKRIWKDYGGWCSNGSGDIYEYISQQGEEVSNNYGATRILSKKDIANFMQFCLEYILRHSPKPATITHAFKYQRDEDGEILEDGNITLFNVDGFEVEFVDDDGNTSLKRMDSDPEYGCVFGFPSEYTDDWELGGYIMGLEACAKILSEVDFDSSIVIYNGGW